MQTDQIDPLSPDAVALKELIKELPAGAQPSSPTQWRWIKKGRNGTKLQAIKVAGVLVTTRTEFRRFIAAIQDQPAPPPEAPAKVNDELVRRGYLREDGP